MADRLPVSMIAADGSTTAGTAAVTATEHGVSRVHDFRDLDGRPLGLPPGGSFVIDLHRSER